MKCELRWIDVTPNLALQQIPIFLLERPLAHGTQPKGGVFNVAEVARLGTFWVPQTDLHQQAIRWSRTASGQYVRVPVFAYRASVPYEAGLFGMAVELGVRAAAQLREHTPFPIDTMTLVLGHQCHVVDAEGLFRGYLGLAFNTKE